MLIGSVVAGTLSKFSQKIITPIIEPIDKNLLPRVSITCQHEIRGEAHVNDISISKLGTFAEASSSSKPVIPS